MRHCLTSDNRAAATCCKNDSALRTALTNRRAGPIFAPSLLSSVTVQTRGRSNGPLCFIGSGLSRGRLSTSPRTKRACHIGACRRSFLFVYCTLRRRTLRQPFLAWAGPSEVLAAQSMRCAICLLSADLSPFGLLPLWRRAGVASAEPRALRLHKRSAEAWETACAREGQRPLGRSHLTSKYLLIPFRT